MLQNWITFIIGLVLTIAFFVIFISNYCGWSCWRRWFKHKEPIKLPTFSQIKAEVRDMPNEQLLTLCLSFFLSVGSASLLAPFLFPEGTPDYIRDIWLCFLAIPMTSWGIIMIRRPLPGVDWNKDKNAEKALFIWSSAIFGCLLFFGAIYDLFKQFFE